MKALLEKIRKILRNRRTRQLLIRTVSVIAAVVVFVTTYALVLPAITMETEALCGLDAHQHDDSCYSKELICGQEESEAHSHTEDCYRKVLVCGKEAHTHSAKCYKGGSGMTAQMEAAAVASTESTAIAEPAQTDDESPDFAQEVSAGSGAAYGDQESGQPEDAESVAAEMGQDPGEDGGIADSEIDAVSDDEEENGVSGPDAASGDEEMKGASGPDAASGDGEEKAASDPDAASGDEGERGAPGTDEAADSAADKDMESGTKETDYGSGNGTADSDKGSGEDPAEADKDGKAASDSAESDKDGKAASDSVAASSTSTVDSSDPKDLSGTAGTEIPSAAGQGYVPVLDQLNFSSVLNKNTAIYYSREDDRTDGTAGEEEGRSFDAADRGREDPPEAAVFESVTDWEKVNKDTELAPADLLRVYLAYTIPAGELNETNATARYRLPSGLVLTDEQIKTINTTVNGIAAQYVDYDKLEILDVEAYENSLGIEAVEGTRCPSDDIREYLKKNDDQEYVSATVKAENVYDKTSGELEGQDLIFTFSPYTVMKNRHEYDAKGKPVKAGEKVRGWVCLDLTTDQVDWETSLITMEEAEDKEDTEETEETVETEEAEEETVEAEEAENAESPAGDSNGNAGAENLTEGAEKETEEEKQESADQNTADQDAGAADSEGDTEEEKRETADQNDQDVDAVNSEGNTDTMDSGDNTDAVDSQGESDAEKQENADQAAVSVRQIEEKTAEVVFAEEDREAGIDEISVKLKMIVVQNSEEAKDSGSDTAEAAEDEGTEAEGNKKEAEAARASGNVDPEDYPAVTFDDKITVTAGSLNTDTESGTSPEKVTELTVHVEADEGTFPAGTTMRLAQADPETVAAALEGAVEGKTRGFHAVDISFWSMPGIDASGDESEDTSKDVSKDTSDDTSRDTSEDISEDTSEDTSEVSSYDSAREPVEIEPLKPIRVSITSEAIRQAVEDSSTAPVVMHIEDSADKASTDKASTDTAEKDSADKAPTEPADKDPAEKDSADKAPTDTADEDPADKASKDNAQQVQDVKDTKSDNTDQAEPAGNVDTLTFEEETAGNTDTLTFEADAFSVYAVVYTVDFHYVVDGKEYSYSITGGSAITLGELLPIVGIAEDDKSTEIDEVKAFLEDVENVTFSDPELVWVEKGVEETTIGTIEDARNLFIQYSAQVTEEQREEIRNKTLNAGDWALISLQPFTSEESLTIRMTDQTEIVIKVKDAQQVGSSEPSEIDVNSSYIICHIDGNGDYHVLKTDGTEEVIAKAVAEANNYKKLDQLDKSYCWTFYYVFREMHREPTMEYIYYFIRPFSDKSVSIALNEVGEPLIQAGANNVAILPQYTDPEDVSTFTGFYFTGYGASLTWDNTNGFCGDDGSLIRLFKQDPLPTYEFTVLSDNEEAGMVSVAGKQQQSREIQVEVEDREGNITIETRTIHYYLAETNTAKNNSSRITATVTNTKTDSQGHPKYLFSHWELNGKTVYRRQNGQIVVGAEDTTGLNLLSTPIDPNTLPIPYNSSELRACFKINPAYVPDAGEDLGRVVDKRSLEAWLADLKTRNIPLSSESTRKTAEVYDYENRIYRVDLASRASLATFAGTIDLGFMIDVSSSMDFPSYLYDAADNENLNGANQNGEWRIGSINETVWVNGRNITRGERWGLNPNRTYYLITKDSSATVFMLRHENDNYNGGTWYVCDASKTYNTENRGNASNGKNRYDSNEYYVIKKAGDLVNNVPRTRSYYLEKSLNTTLDELNTILQILSVADTSSSSNPDVKIAWNSFNNYLPDVSTTDNGRSLQHTFKSARDNKIALNYDHDNTYGGGTSTDIALLDAAGYMRNDVLSNWYAWNDNQGPHANNQNSYSINNYNRIYDGTRRQNWPYYSFEAGSAASGAAGYYNTWYASNYNRNIGYTDAGNRGFQWEANATKYAVLITDGAPQRGGRDIDPRYMEEAAARLESRGVKLITVGLSMDNVPVGSQILYDIASKGNDGLPLYYTAKTGDELEYVLYEILQLIMEDAVVYGDVTDPVGEAFYPIDKETGRPLEAGNVIDLKGKLILKPDGSPATESDLTADQIEAGFGVVSLTDSSSGNAGEYTIRWTDQSISMNGWHGTVYVKAKEDLLGGNGVTTNGGTATFTADKYKVSGQSEVQLIGERAPIYDDNGEEIGPYTKDVTRESPLVNVNELRFTNNNSKWTVYLGENVDPREELWKLYNNILVQEVVNDAADTDQDTYSIPDRINYQSDQSFHFRVIGSDAEATEIGANISDQREDDPDEVQGTAATFKMADLIWELIDDLAAKDNTADEDTSLKDQEGNTVKWSALFKEDDQNQKILDWDKVLELAQVKTQKVSAHGEPVFETDDNGNQVPVMEVTGFKIPYDRYGLDDNSYIQIKLEKSIVENEEDNLTKSPHATTVISARDEDRNYILDENGDYMPVERYDLTVYYSPDYDTVPKGQGGTSTKDFQVGIYGTMYQGHAAGTEGRVNTHIINVFARDFEITKVGMDSIAPITNETAEFKLYRKADSAEITDIQQQEDAAEEARHQSYIDAGKENEYDPADRAPSRLKRRIDLDPGYDPATDPDYDITGLDIDEIAALQDSLKNQLFVDAYTMTTSTADGTAKIEDLPRSPGNIYYMVETKTPVGYTPMPEALKVYIDYKDVFWDISGSEPRTIIDENSVYPDTDPPVPMIDSTTGKPKDAYNWDQEYKENGTTENAKIMISGLSAAMFEKYYKPVQVNKGTEQEPDLENVSNKFYIRNSPGIELPSSGGSGTTLIYIIGMLLAGLAGAGLVIRRRAFR